MFQLFQDEGPQQDLAAGVQAALGFGGAIELGKLGFELGALGLQGFEGIGLALVDGGEFGLDFLAGGHGVSSLMLRFSFRS